MTCDAIVCDWNGTIVGYRDEKPVLESIAVGILRASVPFHVPTVVRILRARRELQRLYTEKRREPDFDYVREMFRVFNGKIIRGERVSVIRRSVDSFAADGRTQAALDWRVLRPIREAHQAGRVTGVFSAGYRYGIERVLTVAGFHRDFDFFEADDLKAEDGKAVEFALNIYQNKPRLLAELLKRRNLDAGRTAYLGDSQDDEGSFEIVKYPIVPFLAPRDVKERYALKYQAFVPDSESDLANYLRRA